jgi:hypothetical protein
MDMILKCLLQQNIPFNQMYKHPAKKNSQIRKTHSLRGGVLLDQGQDFTSSSAF